jgi:hypothetical protein
MKSQLGRRKHFDRAVRRRREIEAHARHVGAADTDDLSRWLIAWVWHNSQSKDQINAVRECARRMGRKGMSPAEALEIIEEASIGTRAVTQVRRQQSFSLVERNLRQWRERGNSGERLGPLKQAVLRTGPRWLSMIVRRFMASCPLS